MAQIPLARPLPWISPSLGTDWGPSCIVIRTTTLCACVCVCLGVRNPIRTPSYLLAVRLRMWQPGPTDDPIEYPWGWFASGVLIHSTFNDLVRTKLLPSADSQPSASHSRPARVRRLWAAWREGRPILFGPAHVHTVRTRTGTKR